jgi:L-alanine-DL-glutamate epimerase-like enolase superfamily enzyme
MKITALEIFPLTFSYKTIIQESFGPVGKREDDVILRLHTDEGITGLGEAMTLGPYYSLESQGTVISLLMEVIGPKLLLGADPFNVDYIHHKMDEMVSEHSIVKTAVDFALYDILAKSLGIPVYKLLGGAYTDRIPLRWALGFGPTQQMVDESLKGTKAGFKALKVKVGMGSAKDVEAVKTIRESVGPEIGITVDFNQAYDTKTAIQIIRKMEQYEILSVEQPVHRRDLYGMNLVRQAVQTPIGACESSISLHDFVQVVKHEAADFINFKVSRSGGFYPGKTIVNMAAASGMFLVGSTQLGTGIELAADAHFAVSTVKLSPAPYHCQGYGTSLFKQFNATDSRGITKDIVQRTPKVENGFLFVPQEPGLGVELHEENTRSFLTPGKEVLWVSKEYTGVKSEAAAMAGRK